MENPFPERPYANYFSQTEPTLADLFDKATVEKLHNTYNTGDITLEELENVFKTLKNGKATGFDGIPAELLKLEGLQDIILKILNLAYRTGKLPDLWHSTFRL